MSSRRITIGPFEFRESTDPEIFKVVEYIKNSPLDNLNLRDCTKSALLQRKWVNALIDEGVSEQIILNAVAITRQSHCDAIAELDRIAQRYGQYVQVENNGMRLSQPLMAVSENSSLKTDDFPKDNF
jgi:hypothetical protein